MNYMYFELYHQVRPRSKEMLQDVRTIRLEERLQANSERLATRLSTSSGEAQCHWYTRRGLRSSPSTMKKGTSRYRMRLLIGLGELALLDGIGDPSLRRSLLGTPTVQTILSET